MTGLVAWWPLHESSGSTARDLSGNSNHGALNGGVTQGVAGKGGLTACSFDGSGDYIDIADLHPYFNSSPSATFSAYVKTSSTSWQVIIGSVGSAYTRSGTMQINSGNLSYYDTAGSHNSSLEVADGEWHHVAVVDDGADIHYYVDGNSETAEGESDGWDGGEYWSIGRREAGPGKYFDGQISNVRAYDRALSPQEIQTLYKWGSGDYTQSQYHDGSDPGAISRWAFDGDAKDSWGPNDGTDNTSTGYSSDAIRGQAKEFDASDDYIDTNINSLQAPFSFFAWIKTNSASKRQAILSNYNASNDDFQFEVYDTGEIRTWGDQLPSVIKGGSISGKEWYHTGVVISSNGPKLFVNGKQVESDQSGSVGEIRQNTNFYIGTKPNDTGDLPFDGIIDEVRIYKRALSPPEIFQLYQWGTRGRDMRKLTVNKR